MISLPTLHVQMHVEPYRAGSPESRVPLPRIDTQRGQRGQQAQAEPSSRDAGTVASGPLAPVGLRAAGRQPAAATASAAAAPIAGTLPDAYIGTPRGDLRSDPQHVGILTDESRQRYVAVGQHHYAIRNDPANQTWRIVQLRDQTKPGIPVRLDPTSQWRVHHDIGLTGGRPLRTHAQIENDLRETRATLEDLLARHSDVRQDVHDALGLIRRYETFQTQTHADQRVIQNDVDFLQGMSEFFARQIERGNADPSFQTALQQTGLQIERKRTSIQALQRMIDEGDAHIGTLRSHIGEMNADLAHIRESIPHTSQRVAELASQLNDFE
ncbi:hotdog family protein [Paraburkholderia sp. 2C]